MKFVIRNIFERKIRTIMIIFSIIISSALFFSALAISKNLENMYVKQITKSFGEAEIMISASKETPEVFFDPAKAYELRDRLDYIIGTVKGTGIYKNGNNAVKVDLMGIDFDDLQTFNPMTLKESSTIAPFSGNKIVLSTKAAEKYNLKLGDTMEIKINETLYPFTISGIAQPAGYFIEFGNETEAVIPLNTFADIYKVDAKVNVVYIKTKDPVHKEQYLKEFADLYPTYSVKETITNSELGTFVNRISTSFKLMTIAILFISIFIIYTSFRVIIMERMPVIGTFRSIGATRRISTFVLMLESFIYGVIGGSLGGLLGIGVLKLMVYFITPSWMKETKTLLPLEFGISHIVIAFLLGVVMALISSMIPIIKASKYPVKDIVLNKIEKKISKNKWRAVVGILLWITAIIIPFYIPTSLAIVVGSICTICVVLGIVLVTPKVMNISIKFIEKIYGLLFGNVGILAAKNLRDNVYMINNILLLAIGLSICLMINSFGVNLINSVVNSYKDMKFDIQISASNGEEEYGNIISSMDGVKSKYGSYEAYSVEIEGEKQKIAQLYGANRDQYLDFFNINIEGDKKEYVSKLDTGRFMLMSSTLQKMMGYEEGDIVSIRSENGYQKYEIIGFYNTLGKEALISERYLKMDMEMNNVAQMYLKTDKSPEYIANILNDKKPDSNFQVSSVSQMTEETLNSNKQIILAMKFFSIMTLVVGVVGVTNNFIVSFMERKRSFAVLRSIGMNKRQLLKMIIIESVTCGLIGGVIGVLGGVSLLLILPIIMAGLSLPISIDFNFNEYLIFILAGILLAGISSILPLMKTSKLNIIESIKYE